jgi:hypothetical protein
MEPGNTDPMLIANAARLAEAYDAELVGLFVKIQDFVNLADLPFTQTVEASTGQIMPLDRSDMEKILNNMAARARKGLSEQAARRQLQWSFQSFTGHPEDIVADHTTSTDIVSLASVASRTLRKTAKKRQPPAMVITRRGLAGERPVTVLYEGQATTLAVGHRIASSLGVNMSVLIAAEHDADKIRFRRNAQAWLRRNHIGANVDCLDQFNRTTLVQQLAVSRPGLVVLSSVGSIGHQMRDLLESEEPNTPLLLIDGK